MNLPSLGLLLAAAIAAAANWLSRARGIRRLEVVTKPAVMVLLIGVVVTLDAADPVRQRWFAAALALSLAGDVFLLLGERWFPAGLGAFLLAHLAFVAGFAAAGISVVPLFGGAMLVAIAAVPVAWRIIVSLRASGQGALVWPIVAYMTIIGAMVASAFGIGSPVAVLGAGPVPPERLPAGVEPLRHSAHLGPDRGDGDVPPRAGRPGAVPARVSR